MKLQAHERQAVFISGGLFVPIIVLLVTNILAITEFVSLIVSGLIAGIGGAFVWGFKDRLKSANVTSHSAEGKEKPTQKSVTQFEQDIMRHTTKLKVDEVDEYVFHFQKGGHIAGRVSSDGLFGIWLVTEASRRSFYNGNDFNAIDGREDVYRCEVKFKAPRSGTFYLLMSNEDRRSITLDVDLKIFYS